MLEFWAIVTLRHLTIFHKNDNKSKLQLLFDNIRNLSSLEEIYIIGSGMNIGSWGQIVVSDAPNHVAHRLLDVVLDEHASHLRTISLSGLTPLTIATFEKIQHTTPKLNRFEINHGLTVNHRESLATPTPWACAANLQHVRFSCGGVHAAIFTRQLAAGAIGHLRTLYMSFYGTESDDETLPVATKWTIPALEVFKLNHSAAWEIRYFTIIHARKVFLSNVRQEDFMEDAQALVTAMTDTTTFPGAIELHVTPEWSDQDFNDLRIACFARDIKVVERDWT